MHRRDIGGQDKGPGLQACHDLHADDGLAAATGQDEHPETASASAVTQQGAARLELVGTQMERTAFPDRHLHRFALEQGYPVVDRIAQLGHQQLDLSPVVLLQQEGAVLLLGEDPHGLAVVEHRSPDDRVGDGKADGAIGLGQERLAPSAGDVAHGEGDRVGDREAGPCLQHVQDFLGAHAHADGVPQADGIDPVGVHVLGALDQRGEADQVGTALLRIGVVDVQKERTVALDDQRALGIHACLPNWA